MEPLCVNLINKDLRHVHIRMHVRRYFRTEESQESVLTIPVGNVTAETELSYDYGVRSKRKKTRIRHRGAAGTHIRSGNDFTVLKLIGCFPVTKQPCGTLQYCYVHHSILCSSH